MNYTGQRARQKWEEKTTPEVCRVCGGPKTNDKALATCSAACGYRMRKQRTRKERPCPVCQTMFFASTQRPKHCSLKCYRKTQHQRPAFVEGTCARCGAKFRRTVAALKRVRHAFCGVECRALFMRGENHGHFRGDKDPNRGANWNRLAAAIRERDSFACRRCGVCECGTKRREKLSVDHVKPWRSFTDKAAANHPSNLVTLCRSCHSYKTTVVEKAWLRGDVVTFKQWVRSLHLKSAVKGITVAQDAAGNWQVATQRELM